MHLRRLPLHLSQRRGVATPDSKILHCGGFYFAAARGGGFRQLSGTEVMPVLFEDAAIFPATGGTTVRQPHRGHGISHPAYSSSYSKACWQCEQLNLIWLITSPFPKAWIIRDTAEMSGFFHGMAPWKGGFWKNKS